MASLTVTARFLRPFSHGRGDDGQPEWPPSPLRLFQALVAAAMRTALRPEDRGRVVEALRWLERQAPPQIIAPRLHATPHTTAYRMFVPDNVADRVARSWAAGRPGEIAEYPSEKDVRAARIADDDTAVHYLFEDVEGLADHLDPLTTAARAMTHLGWGIDQIAGDARGDGPAPTGERWLPGRPGGPGLRTPIAGTLDALERRHEAFLRRIENDLFRPVPPLETFEIQSYTRATDPTPAPFIAFRLLDPRTGTRMALSPPRRTRDVAAWIRHAVDDVTRGWPFGDRELVVHGHAREPARGSHLRFSYLPLPTITPRGTDDLARVMIAAPSLLAEALRWVQPRLAGLELVWRDEPVAILEPLPASDGVLDQYTRPSTDWSSVTPVVLPGHHDRSARKAEGLLRRAFLQAGLAPEIVASIEELEWRDVGFRPGLDLARRYLPPDKITGPQFHVRVRFPRPIAGPISIGSGRHRGLGTLASEK